MRDRATQFASALFPAHAAWHQPQQHAPTVGPLALTTEELLAVTPRSMKRPAAPPPPIQRKRPAREGAVDDVGAGLASFLFDLVGADGDDAAEPSYDQAMAHSSNHAVWGGYPPSMSVIGEELPGAEQTLAPDTPPSHSVKTQAPPASSVTETWHPPAVASSVLVQVDDADGSERWVLATVQSHTRASERSPCTSFVVKLPANAGASRMPRQERLTRATEGSSWRRMMPKRNERIEAEVDWGEGELEWAKARVLKRLFATGEFTAVICYPDGTEDDEFVETYKLDAEGVEWRRAGTSLPQHQQPSRPIPPPPRRGPVVLRKEPEVTHTDFASRPAGSYRGPEFSIGQCERNPLCVRGFRHLGRGGKCSTNASKEPEVAKTDFTSRPAGSRRGRPSSRPSDPTRSDGSKITDTSLARELGVHRATIWRRRQKELKEGLAGASIYQTVTALRRETGEEVERPPRAWQPSQAAPVTPWPAAPTKPRPAPTPRRPAAPLSSSSPDCNQCKFCLDKPKNGGANTLRRPCMMREKAEVVTGSYGSPAAPVEVVTGSYGWQPGDD